MLEERIERDFYPPPHPQFIALAFRDKRNPVKEKKGGVGGSGGWGGGAQCIEQPREIRRRGGKRRKGLFYEWPSLRREIY